MHVFKIWRILCLLGFVCASLCVNEVEYDENYDNEISPDQQEGETPTPACQAADFSRWDKLFIALEDSHMRQNMLLESLGQCCGGMHTIRNQVDKLVNGTSQEYILRLESACRAQWEQASLRLQRGLVELQKEEAEKERRLNATLQQLLHSSHEGNTRLKRLEEISSLHGIPSGAADSRVRHQPTQRPGGFGAAFSSGVKLFPSGLKEQDVTSPFDMVAMEKALVSIATELQRVHWQLSRVIEQAGTLRKNRGDT